MDLFQQEEAVEKNYRAIAAILRVMFFVKLYLYMKRWVFFSAKKKSVGENDEKTDYSIFGGIRGAFALP